MANCLATLGYAGNTGCAPAAGTYTDIYFGNFDEVTLDAEGTGASRGKVPGFTMAATKTLFKIRMWDQTGEFAEKYNGADAASWDTSISGLLKSLSAAARNVFQDNAGAKLIFFVPLKSGEIKIVGCDDGAYLDTNDASSKSGSVGEAFKYTAKSAAKKALELFDTDRATTIASLEAAL